jgi:NhaA family Na+:H+ antiporter
MCYILIRFKWASFPERTGWKHLFGAAMLASVGFTMSLFITDLAFSDGILILQAKLGILVASLIGGFAGYYLLKRVGKASGPTEVPVLGTLGKKTGQTGL